MIPCLALFTSCDAIMMDPWPDRNYCAFLARGEGQSQAAAVGYSITAFARPNYYQRLWVKSRVEEMALGCDVGLPVFPEPNQCHSYQLYYLQCLKR